MWVHDMKSLDSREVCLDEERGKQTCDKSVQCFFHGRIFAKFGPENYDFSKIYTKGFFMGKKIAQICQILKKNNSKNRQIFMMSSSR
jgi:hypothetical protein